ncbi:MAG TPA: hypothetical protein EYN79_08620 [Planctomycetes bacterium]|nr:hypothetical protein [Planctomycetota bacterium]HIN80837.1 hypothetical protein [Planctomycetota bacterium]
MLNAIWQKHRGFLIRVSVGLALFLVISNFASSMREDQEKLLNRKSEEAQILSSELEKLDGRFDVERSARSVLQLRCEELAGKIGLSASSRHHPPVGETLSTDFKRAKDGVWAGFTDRANRVNIRYPQVMVNFDERGDLSDEEWVDRYRLLEVLDRFLGAALQSSIARIDEVTPGARMQEPIPGGEEFAIARYPLRLKIACSARSLAFLAGRFQKDEEFISFEPRLIKLDDSSPGLLSVEVDIVGVDLEESRQRQGRSRGSGRGRGGYR